jgi:acetyl-CoA acetyltransferase
MTVGIVGVAETAVGKRPEVSGLGLYAEAVIAAAADANLRLSELECVMTANSRVTPYLYHAETIAEYLGIEPRLCLTVGTGGSTSIALVHQAQALIQAGACRNAIVVAADNLATGLGTDRTVESMAGIGHPQLEAPYGVFIPALYALVAQRYLSYYSIDPAAVAEVAVADRMHAARNPAAQYRTPLSVDDVLASKLISSPLHLLECSPVSDAGAAVVLGCEEVIESSGNRLVSVLGYGEAHPHEHLVQSGDLSRTGAEQSGKQAYHSAGLRPADVDVAYVYDAFGFIQCMQLEDLGFCDRGEGAAFVKSGATRPGGSLPTNTNGGVLSHSHAGKPSALLLLVEAVRQLRNQCGDRQVPGASTAIVHAEGGILASHSTMLVGAR